MRHPFLRTLTGASAVATDPNFENVTLLLHGDGTNGGQNNTFVDGSTNNFTITRNGNTTQGTFSPYGDNWSNYFDGVDDYLSLTGGALGTSQFCVELWYYPTASLTNAGLYDGRTTNGSSTGILIRHGNNSGSATTIDLIVGATTISKSGLVINSWNHIAICRNASNTTNVFVNGSAATSATISTNLTDTGVRVGAFVAASGSPFAATGYVSNLRVVIGSSVYDPTQSTLTVPTAPLTAITNTSLLTCSTNRFRDVSSNNRTITRNGNVSVQRFSPFSPTAAYAAGTIGGSGYFDGTGDYLSRAFTSTTDGMYPQGTTYTIEAWFYASATTGLRIIYDCSASNVASFGGVWLGMNAGAAQFNCRPTTGGTLTSISGGAIAANSWNHIAASVDAGSGRLFLNGTQVGSTTTISACSFTPVGASVGRISNGYTTGVTDYAGYISDARLVQSTALYTATFTPPTAPLTAITNTSLLLNFQNAAILDNAMMAVPETVGNAQIDTTVKKYGTGSLEFDGTGDWLLVPDSPDQRLGTGNFTIECWLYLSATGTARGIVGKGTSTTGWLLSTNTSNAVVFTYGTSTITSTGTLSGTTWYHIAVVREGTGSNQTKIYIDGTNDGTGTVSTDFTQTNAAYVGANRTGGDPMNGYIDDLRITKGVARYTANFTAPTAAFPDL